MIQAYLARVQWKLGKKDAAIASAKGMLENLGRFPEGPSKAFAQSFKDGEPQTLKEFMTSLRAASKPVPAK